MAAADRGGLQGSPIDNGLFECVELLDSKPSVHLKAAEEEGAAAAEDDEQDDEEEDYDAVAANADETEVGDDGIMLSVAEDSEVRPSCHPHAVRSIALTCMVCTHAKHVIVMAR